LSAIAFTRSCCAGGVGKVCNATEKCIEGSWTAMLRRSPWRTPFYSISVLDTSTAALLRLLLTILSGWWDLNPRPVAAATALLSLIELISAAPALVISLTLCCFGPRGKAFTVNQNPRHAMLSRFGIASVMAANALSQIFAGADVAPSGFLAAQYVTIKHYSPLVILSGWWDLNPRPPGPEPGALPS